MNKILLLTASLIGFVFATPAQNTFYQLDSIQDIWVYFGFSNRDYRMNTAIAANDSYTLADSVMINGTCFTNCGVSSIINSSGEISMTESNPVVKIKFSAPQNYQGSEQIKLTGRYTDSLNLAEPEPLRKQIHANESDQVRLFINDTFVGIMAINKYSDLPIKISGEAGTIDSSIANLTADNAANSFTPTVVANTGFILLPNPASSQVHYTVTDNTELLKISIVSFTGQTLISFRPQSQGGIDISDLANGIYFVSLETKKGKTQTMKLIKQ